MGPNFFSYAKTELTNDGFICWLLDWCKYPGAELYGVANDLLAVLLNKQADSLHVTDLKIHQQYKNIDILLEINGEFLIVIEDKIDSREHSNQLAQYKEVIETDFPSYKQENRNFIYLKIGDQSSYQAVESVGYRLVHREDLLRMFANHTYIQHPLFRQYVDHLTAIQNQVGSYADLPVADWSARAWQGFYMELQSTKKLPQNHWGYVSNSNGGFWGFWWNHTPFPSPAVPEYWTYLQIEEKRITFKVEIADPDRPGTEKSVIRNEIWNTFAPILEESSLKNPPMKTRFRQGTWMSIAEITDLTDQESLTSAINDAEALMAKLNQTLQSKAKA